MIYSNIYLYQHFLYQVDYQIFDYFVLNFHAFCGLPPRDHFWRVNVVTHAQKCDFGSILKPRVPHKSADTGRCLAFSDKRIRYQASIAGIEVRSYGLRGIGMVTTFVFFRVPKPPKFDFDGFRPSRIPIENPPALKSTKNLKNPLRAGGTRACWHSELEVPFQKVPFSEGSLLFFVVLLEVSFSEGSL